MHPWQDIKKLNALTFPFCCFFSTWDSYIVFSFARGVVNWREMQNLISFKNLNQDNHVKVIPKNPWLCHPISWLVGFCSFQGYSTLSPNHNAMMPPGLPPMSIFRPDGQLPPSSSGYSNTSPTVNGSEMINSRGSQGSSQTGDALGKALASVSKVGSGLISSIAAKHCARVSPGTLSHLRL